MAKRDDLVARATELGIEFNTKTTIPVLEQLIADKEAGARANAENTPGNDAPIQENNGDANKEATVEPKGDEVNAEDQEAIERLIALKDMATELEIDFNDDSTIPELEEKIQKALDDAKAITDAEAEAKAKAEAEEAKADKPKLNKDGFEIGKPVSNEDLFRHMAKQKAKK